MKYSIKKRSAGIKALPINFKGKFLGFAFSILNQFDIYGKVAAEFYSISEDRFLFALDGSGSVESAINNLYGKVVGSLNYNLDDRDTKNLKKDISKFLKQVNSEVKNYNSTNKNILVKKEVIIKKPVKLMIHRKKTAKKKVYKQANSSNIIYDKRLQAKKPGKRKSAAGNIYYENRENRSDKGRLLGIGNITMDKLHKVNKDIINMELALDKNIKTSKLFQYKTPFWKKELAKNKKNIKKFIIELKKHKTELKKLL
jgi:hypothetical protein